MPVPIVPMALFLSLYSTPPINQVLPALLAAPLLGKNAPALSDKPIGLVSCAFAATATSAIAEIRRVLFICSF